MATYTRQSSSGIVDGGVIEASDLNNEFNQVASAFLQPTFGVGTAGTDIVMTFDGETNDGVITWMEDEDYFKISDDLLIETAEKLQFRDTGLYIYSSADGQLDLVADTEIQIAATTVDINGAVALNGAITGATNITLSGELDAATLDISGDADIDGTLEADAITINGVTLAETISDTVGAMVTSNTESGITVAYDDGDNTLDFTVGTLNQDTTGNAATATILETARTIGGTSFNGSANIAVALSATATALATARTIHGVSFDGTANIDLSEVISDTVGAMVSSNTESGITVTYQDADNTLDFTIGTLNQDTTGNADTATALATARTIHGVSFDGSANIDLSEVISDTVGAMVSSNTETGITVTYQDADNTLDFVIGSGVITNAMLAGSIADSNLSTISTANKINVAALDIDGATDIGADIADADLFVIDDAAGGTNRKVAASRIKTYIGSSVAADDIAAGDAAINITTSSGDITIDAAANDSDIIFKGTDGGADTTFLTIDGSAAGAATFNDKIIATELDISGDVDVDGTLEADAITINGTAIASVLSPIAGGSGIVTTGAINSGSITSGFGTIDTGSSTITTTGLISGGSLDIDNVLINGTTIGHTDDTDLITVADSLLTIDGDVTITGGTPTLTIGDAGAEDAKIVFDGNAQDFHIGLDDSADDLVIGKGSALGTTPVISIDENLVTTFGGAARGKTLTAGSQTGNVTLDFNANQNFVLTATGNVTLVNPSTEAVGQSGIIVFIQDGTGSRTLSTGTDYETPAAAALTISTAANSIDVIPYFVSAANSIKLGAAQIAFG